MPETNYISKVQLPSGGVYEIKDATAREMISGGVAFNIVWTSADYESTTAPTRAKLATIPAGVTVYYNSGASSAVGTLSAETSASAAEPHAQAGSFYLVKSETSTSGAPNDVYDEYVPVGSDGSKTWEKIGDTQIDLSDVVTNVSLNKVTDVVLGEGTTFTAAPSAVTFAGESTDVVLGEGTTFALSNGSVSYGALTGHTDTVLGTGTTFSVTEPTITVTPATTYVKATATGGNTAWNSKDAKTVVTGYASPTTDTFVKSVTAETNKNLVTTTVPNVTSAGSASTWTFRMGETADTAETLIIGGGNSTAPTLGTAITVATGSTSTTGTGDPVVTGVTIGTSGTAITGLGTASTASVIGSSSTFTITQPTVALATDTASATGRVQVATGISGATASGTAVSASGDSVNAVVSMPTGTVGTGITVGTADKVTVLTDVGTGTAAAQAITVGTNDKVTTLTNTTTLNVTYGGNA